MIQIRKRSIACAALLLCLTVGLSFAISNGEKAKVSGVITGRTGETLTVNSAESGKVIIVLNDDTKVQQPKGLGLRKKQMSATVLIPGLKVSVDGVGDAQSRVVARLLTSALTTWKWPKPFKPD